MNGAMSGRWPTAAYMAKKIVETFGRVWTAFRKMAVKRSVTDDEVISGGARSSGSTAPLQSASAGAPAAAAPAETGAAPSRRVKWSLRILGWVRTALRWRQPARDGGAYPGAVRSSGAERRQVMLEASAVLTQEIRRHHDPSVQAQMGASQCNLLLRSHRRGLFGSITISENLHMSYEFQGTRPVPLGLYDEVGHLFADENRRHPTNRWQVVPHTGVISFTGELQLRGDPGEDRRLMRRYALRRMDVVRRRLSRLFVQWESRSRARQGACTEKARAAG